VLAVEKGWLFSATDAIRCSLLIGPSAAFRAALMARRRNIFICTLACAMGALTAFASGSALAIGYYNAPGSFCQCFGYGNGAGHHACLVLGPSTCHGFCSTHEVRLECPPQPPYAYYNCGLCGTASQGSWIDETVPVPIAPQPEPQPAPTPAAMRPQVHRQPRVW
jgi:hypothetical protein